MIASSSFRNASAAYGTSIAHPFAPFFLDNSHPPSLLPVTHVSCMQISRSGKWVFGSVFGVFGGLGGVYSYDSYDSYKYDSYDLYEYHRYIF